MKTTQPQTFCVPDDIPVFSVNAEVPLTDALEQTVILLDGVTRLLMTDSLDNDAGRNTAQYLLEMANALVAACLVAVRAKAKAA
ncbi:hypothetical protein ACVW0Y_000576 [Pseudomonas sp. TE3786]